MHFYLLFLKEQKNFIIFHLIIVREMIEIYDSLSQITLTKAQILEEVLENKFKAQQLVLPSSF